MPKNTLSVSRRWLVLSFLASAVLLLGLSTLSLRNAAKIVAAAPATEEPTGAITIEEAARTGAAVYLYNKYNKMYWYWTAGKRGYPDANQMAARPNTDGASKFKIVKNGDKYEIASAPGGAARILISKSDDWSVQMEDQDSLVKESRFNYSATPRPDLAINNVPAYMFTCENPANAMIYISREEWKGHKHILKGSYAKEVAGSAAVSLIPAQ